MRYTYIFVYNRSKLSYCLCRLFSGQYLNVCLDLNLFLFCRVPDVIQKVTYQERLEGRYDVVFIEIPPLN